MSEGCRKDVENLTLLNKTPFRRRFAIVPTFGRIPPFIGIDLIILLYFGMRCSKSSRSKKIKTKTTIKTK